MKIMTILGTRPEIIRLSRVIEHLDQLCEHVLVHTGQNFDSSLSDLFFQQLGVRAPDSYLGVRGDTFGEQIGMRRAWALVLGFIGVVVLASGRTGSGAAVWPAALAGATASLCYGFGGNLLKRYLQGVPASAVASATLICASLLVAPVAIATWPHHPVPLTSWVSAALLGVMCTGLAYVLYYRLIHRIGAPRASTVTYIIPLFGVIWAWLLLSEPLTPSMALAGVLILSGVALSQTPKKR